MKSNPTLALLTDFGVHDNFVGVMKGVILKINPRINIIDISHSVSSQNITEAAFVLSKSYSHFSKGSVFLSVVDPGVGSRRSAIAVKTKDYYFVAPDNGVLSLALQDQTVKDIVKLQNKKYFLKEISSTFHGRDIFAPCAAYISKGLSLTKLGPRIKRIKRISLPAVVADKNKLKAEVIYQDKFGNLVTNLKKKDLVKFLKGKDFIASLNAKKFKKLYSFYEQAKDKEAFFVEGSFSCLEISLKNKSAAKHFGLKKGDRAKIIIKK